MAVDSVAGGEKQTLQFETQVDTIFSASADNSIRIVRDPPLEALAYPSPYGPDLALIDRKSFCRLIDLGIHETHQQEQWFGVYSLIHFPIIP